MDVYKAFHMVQYIAVSQYTAAIFHVYLIYNV